MKTEKNNEYENKECFFRFLFDINNIEVEVHNNTRNFKFNASAIPKSSNRINHTTRM